MAGAAGSESGRRGVVVYNSLPFGGSAATEQTG